MDGRVVIVTGAASGIGLATAERVLAEGGSVLGADLVDGPDLGDRWASTHVDVADEASVAAMVKAAVDAFGRVDGVLNAAGVAGGGPVHWLDLAEWKRVIDINLTGTFLVAKHVIGQLMQQEPVDGQRGSVVTVASVEGLEGTAGGSCYNASKGGVVLLTKNIAIDYGSAGIRCNAICPGFIDTPMLRDVFASPELRETTDGIIHEHKLRRLGQAKEIASTAAFLLSADASFVSGQAIAVDGAYTAGRDHGVTDRFGFPPA